MRAPVWRGLAGIACLMLVACTAPAPATVPPHVPASPPPPTATVPAPLPVVPGSPTPPLPPVIPTLPATATAAPAPAPPAVATAPATATPARPTPVPAPTTVVRTAPAPAPPVVATAPPTATPAPPTVVRTTPPTIPPVIATPPATAPPAPPIRAIPTATAAALAATPPSGACQETQGRLSVAPLDSAVLGRRIVYSIYLPPCYAADPARLYPTLYLLPGANADHTQWPDLTLAPDADRLIAQQAIPPLVVVMPDGDYQPGVDYAAFVLRDLLPHIEQTTRVARDGRQRAIGGLSRGGWWALLLAFAHPDLFSAVGGHSPVTEAPLPQRLAQLDAASAPRIYLDVGRDDSLAPGVTAFANTLTAQGLHPLAHVYPGAHNRLYWRAHTAEYLRFYAMGWPVR